MTHFVLSFLVSTSSWRESTWLFVSTKCPTFSPSSFLTLSSHCVWCVFIACIKMLMCSTNPATAVFLYKVIINKNVGICSYKSLLLYKLKNYITHSSMDCKSVTWLLLMCDVYVILSGQVSDFYVPKRLFWFIIQFLLAFCLHPILSFFLPLNSFIFFCLSCRLFSSTVGFLLFVSCWVFFFFTSN